MNSNQNRLAFCFIPSVIYFFFIALPSVFNLWFNSLPSKISYLFFTLIIFSIIFLFDFIAFYMEKIASNICNFRIIKFNLKYLIVVITILSVIFLIINVMLQKKIPILTYIFSDENYALFRASLSKHNVYNYYASYLINIVNFAFIPIIFLYGIEYKDYKFVSISVLIFILTGLFFLSLFPFAFLTICLFITCINKYLTKNKVIIFLLLALAFSFSVTLIAINDYKNKYENHKLYGIADLFRNIELKNKLLQKSKTLIYRSYWVPSEVSGVWFDYYINGDDANKGYSLNYPNLIGREYYFKKDSAYFTKDIYAFASFDVDVLVRYGFAGLISILFVWGLVRIFIAYYLNNPDFLKLKLYGLLFCGVILTIGSVPALLISNGFILFLILAFLIMNNRNNNESMVSANS